VNLSTAIFLVNNDVQAVRVSYDVDAEGKPVGNLGTFKTFDKGLEVGAFVVVPTDTRHRMTVCRVEAVGVEVDLDSPVQMNWLVGQVDSAAFEAIATQEQAVIERIKAAEVTRKKRELAEKLLADNPDIRALSAVETSPGSMLPSPAFGGSDGRATYTPPPGPLRTVDGDDD
jgi:hypothetical protein